MRCVGTVTASWIGSTASGSVSVIPLSTTYFNGVRVEQVSSWTPGAGPATALPSFVWCRELEPFGVIDVLNGKELRLLSPPGQFTGGAALTFGSYSPDYHIRKTASSGQERFRSPILNFSIYGADGNVYSGAPANTTWSVTISLWKIDE